MWGLVSSAGRVHWRHNVLSQVHKRCLSLTNNNNNTSNNNNNNSGDTTPDVTSFLQQRRAREVDARLFRLSDERMERFEQRSRKTQASLRDFRYPSDSLVELLVPLGSQKGLRESYVNFMNQLRIGKVLEDLDAMAGEIAYQHAGGGAPLTIVTASVDKIFLKAPVTGMEDVFMRGNVTWVGSSSMEITIRVFQGAESARREIMESSFVMVARDPSTGGSRRVPPLKCESPEDISAFEAGEANKQRRIEKSKQSLDFQPPSSDERLTIHQLYLESRDHKVTSDRYKTIASTMLQKTVIIHPQERNIHGKAFGGHLLQQAFDLAWVCARQYSAERPTFLSLDDNAFLKPVEIGAIVIFDGAVCFADDKNRILVCRVEVDVLDEHGRRERTNLFHFSFRVPGSIKRALPLTYEESMEYLQGKRIHESNLKMLQLS